MSMRLLALVMLPVLLTGCVAAQDGESAAGPAETAAAGTFAGANLDVGASGTHKMFTHCGVESIKINGGWWNAVTPLYGASGEGAGPPVGWNEPWQEGTLTLEAEGRAVFAAVGQRVVLQPSATDEPIRLCR